MSILGLGRHDLPSGDIKLDFRSGCLKTIGIGLGAGGGIAVVMAAFQLLERQPKEAFDLLKAWGPTFIVVLFCLYIFGTFLNGINDTVRESFTALVESGKQGAAAQGQMAAAMNKIAEKDDRQLQEIQNLVGYNAQQHERLHRRMGRQDQALKAIMESLHVPSGMIELDTDGGRQ